MATTSSPVEIPLIAAPQDLFVTLAGVSYGMSIRWIVPAQYWTLDIFDANNELLIGGLPMLCGQDLIAQYPNTGINGSLWVTNDAVPGQSPGYNDLGASAHLLFLPLGLTLA